MSFIKPKVQEKNSLYRFMSDTHTVGTEEYYRNKFGDKFPDELYKYFEVKARPEYDEKDEKNLIEQINEYRLNYEKQLLNELKERENENKDNSEVEIDLTQLLICE
jgi:undecaprenyl pyrophosphate synthase